MFSNIGIISSQITQSWKWSQLSITTTIGNTYPNPRYQTFFNTSGIGVIVGYCGNAYTLNSSNDTLTLVGQQPSDLNNTWKGYASIDNKFYVLGGNQLFKYYDISANSWSNLPNCPNYCNELYMVKLSDTKIWASQGSDGTKCYMYDVTCGSWSSASSNNSLFDRRMGYCLLSNGKVFACNDYRYSLFDPAANSWTNGNRGSPYIDRGPWCSSCMDVPNGCLIFGAESSYTAAMSKVEFYNQTTGTFTQVGTTQVPRSWPRLSKLPDGNILISEGFYVLGYNPSSEIYNVTTNTSSFTSNNDPVTRNGTSNCMHITPNGNVYMFSSGTNIPISKCSFS
jgi:hypothetical protein